MVRFSPAYRVAALAALASIATGSLVAHAQDEAAPDRPVRRIAEIAVSAVEADAIFEAGGDILARHHDAYHALLTDAAYAQLAARGIPMKVTVEDVDTAYAAYRSNLKRGRAEDFTDYHNNAAVVAILERIAGQYPNLTTLETIGESLEGRPIYALRVSENPATADAKPAILIMGCHHAREWISVEVPLYYADYLTEQFRRDGDVTRLLKRTDIWIVPVVNPDGFEYSWTDDRWWRKNRRPSEYSVASSYRESDGGQTREWTLSIDSDVPQFIYSVTVDGVSNDFASDWLTDENGDVDVVLSTSDGTFPPRFPPSADGARLVVNRDEVATYTGGNGVWTAAGDGINAYGVDNNRNYGYEWGLDIGSSGHPRSETYRGPAPFSEPETQVIRDLMDSREFLSAISYHNYSQLILYPKGYSYAPVANAREYHQLALEMATLINSSHADPSYNYGFGQGSLILYPTSGDFTDWAHHVKGALAYTIEVRPAGPPYFELPPVEILPTCRENLPAFLHMAHQTLIPNAKLADTDRDGFLDDEDYCPNSPTAIIDEIGCDPSEADLDKDGVLNGDDACRDTPPLQVVDADGCRITPVLTVHVTSNLRAAPVTVDPRDIDGAVGGPVGEDGLSFQYAAEETLILAALPNFAGSRFREWIVDGTPQPAGQSRIIALASADMEAEAIYAVPETLNVIGPRNVPHEAANGFANVVSYAATVTYDDGREESFPSQSVTWRVEPGTAASIDTDGEMIVRTITGAEGVVVATLTATATIGGVTLEAEPAEIHIYDPAVYRPACDALEIEGLDSVASLDTESYAAFVTIADGGGVQPAASVAWSVLAGEGLTGAPPASVDAAGVLTTDWVASNTPVRLVATYTPDAGAPCTAERVVTVLAGNPADDPEAGRDVGRPGAVCGATSMLPLLMMLGALPLMRRRRA